MNTDPALQEISARSTELLRLIYYEVSNDVHSAISREKQIKAWRRRKKLDLVREPNPSFQDLGADLFDD